MRRDWRKSYVVDEATGCWNWTGVFSGAGYSRLGGRYVHRVAYAENVGPIPEGFQVDHLCRNRACVNPAHLEAVTPRENNRRSDSATALHGRATHCPQGHPYDESNTSVSPEGFRRCRACARYKATVRRSLGLEPPVHGAAGYTNWGCRCETCIAAKRESRVAS